MLALNFCRPFVITGRKTDEYSGEISHNITCLLILKKVLNFSEYELSRELDNDFSLYNNISTFFKTFLNVINVFKILFSTLS